MFAHFDCTVSLVLSLFRSDCGVVLLLPCSIIITESSCLMVVFYEIVYIYWGHTSLTNSN